MRLLIWDFDGTLAHRRGMWTRAVIDVLDANEPQHQVTDEEVRSHLQSGFPWHSPNRTHEHLANADDWWQELQPVFNRTYAAIGFEKERAAQLGSCLRRAYCDTESWSLYPETIEVLQSLKHDGWTQVLLSNHVPELNDIVAHLGLSHLFAEIFNSALTGVEKPHPAAYRRVLLSYPNAEVKWMVGDSMSADVEGAEQAGILGILVRRKSDRAGRYCDDLLGVRAIIDP